MSVGKRIYLKREMPDPQIMEQFKTIPASNTADVMGRSCAMNPRIRLVSSPSAQMMVGPAYTVKCRAGDNLTLHAALNFCNEGDVLVVSNEEDDTRALMGEVMMAYLRYTKKIAGIILDGPIRDIDEIGKWDFPVYCTGTTPGGLTDMALIAADLGADSTKVAGMQMLRLVSVIALYPTIIGWLVR